MTTSNKFIQQRIEEAVSHIEKVYDTYPPKFAALTIGWAPLLWERMPTWWCFLPTRLPLPPRRKWYLLTGKK